VADGSREEAVERVLEGSRHGGGELEDRPHDSEEQQRAGDRCRHPAIHLVGQGEAVVAWGDGRHVCGIREPREAVVVEHQGVVGDRRLPRVGHGVGEGCTGRGRQGDHACTTSGVGSDHGAGEFPRQQRGVDGHLALRGDVRHGDGHDDPGGELADLGDQVEAVREAGCVDGDDAEVGALVDGPVLQQAARQLLVGGVRVEAVRAGQVQESDRQRIFVMGAGGVLAVAGRSGEGRTPDAA